MGIFWGLKRFDPLHFGQYWCSRQYWWVRVFDNERAFFANIVVEIIAKNVLFSHICRVSRADSEATGFVFFGCVWAENEPSPE